MNKETQAERIANRKQEGTKNHTTQEKQFTNYHHQRREVSNKLLRIKIALYRVVTIKTRKEQKRNYQFMALINNKIDRKEIEEKRKSLP